MHVPCCRHSLHAIATQLSPAPGCTGIELLLADTFDLHCFQTLTGTKMLMVVEPGTPDVDVLLQDTCGPFPAAHEGPPSLHANSYRTCTGICLACKKWESALPCMPLESVITLAMPGMQRWEALLALHARLALCTPLRWQACTDARQENVQHLRGILLAQGVRPVLRLCA